MWVDEEIRRTMATEPDTEPDTSRSGVPDDGELVEFVDGRLFGDSTDSLERFTARKKALAHPVRYAMLYYLFESMGADESRRVARKELKRLLDREKNSLDSRSAVGRS